MRLGLGLPAASAAVFAASAACVCFGGGPPPLSSQNTKQLARSLPHTAPVPNSPMLAGVLGLGLRVRVGLRVEEG